MELSQEKLISIGIVLLLSVSAIATVVYYSDDSEDLDSTESNGWVDPIVEVENCENCTGLDQSHQHTNLAQHFLQTDALSQPFRGLHEQIGLH